jgi:hypothetical protein
MRPCLAILAVVLAGCTTMDHERVEGWPELEIVEHYVPGQAMHERCRKYVTFGSLPLACAEFNLAAKRCDIWYSTDFPPTRSIIDHERLHCAGYDHVGSSGMRQLLQRYLASTVAKAAP